MPFTKKKAKQNKTTQKKQNKNKKKKRKKNQNQNKQTNKQTKKKKRLLQINVFPLKMINHMELFFQMYKFRFLKIYY